MKALSLWQPWASLIALGAKDMETRSWSTPYRGALLIHAAKRRPDMATEVTMQAPEFRRALAGVVEIPMGAAVCVVDLVDVLPTDQVKADVFGNFGFGRFAWVLRNVRVLSTPIPMVGRQGLFNVPAEMAARVMADLEGAARA